MKTNYKENIESKEYYACSYTIDGMNVLERTAKITPKKIGQFVTCWKRNIDGITEPYKETDAIDFFIIKVNSTENSGEFKFTKVALIKHGILSTVTKDGKRGFRVYPIWDTPTSKQALKTQSWQLHYFKNNTKRN
jgi:hypothetical protein